MGEALITRRGGGGKSDYFTYTTSGRFDPRSPISIPDGFNNKGACDNISVWGQFEYGTTVSTISTKALFLGDMIEISGNDKTYTAASDGTTVTIDLINCFSSSSAYRYANDLKIILIKEV